MILRLGQHPPENWYAVKTIFKTVYLMFVVVAYSAVGTYKAHILVFWNLSGLTSLERILFRLYSAGTKVHRCISHYSLWTLTGVCTLHRETKNLVVSKSMFI